MQFVHYEHIPLDTTVVFTTMVLLVTKVVLSERICFLRFKKISNIKVVTFKSIYIKPSRNSEDSFETSPHTLDQALRLLLKDTVTLVIFGPTRPGFGKNSLLQSCCCRCTAYITKQNAKISKKYTKAKQLNGRKAFHIRSLYLGVTRFEQQSLCYS